MSARIAVTGANGFIGRHVMEAFKARGDRAVAIARPYRRDALAQTLQGTDAVVHLAGVVSAVRETAFYDGNVDNTRIVAEAVRDVNARLVHISSLAAAGPAPPSAPRREDDPCLPINAYGRSKLEGERVVATTTGLVWTTLRPGVVYGPGDRAMRPLFRSAQLGILPLVGNRTAAYTFIYIADLVRAILAAVDRGIGGDTIFLGHPKPVAPRELIEAVRDTLGSRAAILPVPRALARLAAEFGELAGTLGGKPATINRRRFVELYSPGFVCCVDRMQERLGVAAETDLRAGFQKARNWYVRTARPE